MIHRDIKPANILCTLTHSHAFVDDDGPTIPSVGPTAAQSRLRADTTDSQRSSQSTQSPRQRSLSVSVKIADFGISKVIDENDSPARTFIGTIVYMSPERITGESVYSYPSDIWSFGLAMLTVADGHFPDSKTSRSSRGKQSLSQQQSPIKSNRSHSRSPLRSPLRMPPSAAAAVVGTPSKMSPGPSAAQYNDDWRDDMAETENDDDLGDLNGGGFWTMIKAICGELLRLIVLLQYLIMDRWTSWLID